MNPQNQKYKKKPAEI